MSKDSVARRAMKCLLTQRERLVILTPSKETKEAVITEMFELAEILELKVTQQSHGMLIFPDIECRIFVLEDWPEVIGHNEDEVIFRLHGGSNE